MNNKTSNALLDTSGGHIESYQEYEGESVLESENDTTPKKIIHGYYKDINVSAGRHSVEIIVKADDIQSVKRNREANRSAKGTYSIPISSESIFIAKK